MSFALLRRVALGLVLGVAGCDGTTVTLPPLGAVTQSSQRVIEAGTDVVWDRLMSALAGSSFKVGTADRSSGRITIVYAGDPERYVDCGRITSRVADLRGPRTYSFAAAHADQIYEVVNTNGRFVLDRRTSLEARTTLTVAAIGPGRTRVSAATRYVLARQVTVSRPQGQSEALPPASMAFTSGGDASFPASIDAPQGVTCSATGALEQVLLDLAG